MPSHVTVQDYEQVMRRCWGAGASISEEQRERFEKASQKERKVILLRTEEAAQKIQMALFNR